MLDQGGGHAGGGGSRGPPCHAHAERRANAQAATCLNHRARKKGGAPPLGRLDPTTTPRNLASIPRGRKIRKAETAPPATGLKRDRAPP
jgi:hypothetical protein